MTIVCALFRTEIERESEPSLHLNRCLKMTIRIFHSFDSIQNRCCVSDVGSAHCWNVFVCVQCSVFSAKATTSRMEMLKIRWKSLWLFHWLARKAYEFIILFSWQWPRRARRMGEKRQQQQRKQISSNFSTWHRFESDESNVLSG